MHKILTNMSLYQIITELEQYPADFTDSLVALSLSYSFLYATQKAARDCKAQKNYYYIKQIQKST